MPPQNTTTNITAASIMDLVASLMNDTAKTVYTYVAQLPYLQMALNELQEGMQLASIAVTQQTSTEIEIPANTEVVNPVVGHPPNTTPNYPADLIEIEQIWERLAGSSDPWISVTRKDYLPHYLEGPTPLSNELIFWTWQDQRIKFLPASTDREIKLDYIKSIFPNPVTEDSIISIINSSSFLQYRTAALCSEFIGENPSRSASLNQNAVLAWDRVLGINVKGGQVIGVRRRPFRSGYKARSTGGI